MSDHTPPSVSLSGVVLLSVCNWLLVAVGLLALVTGLSEVDQIALFVPGQAPLEGARWEIAVAGIGLLGVAVGWGVWRHRRGWSLMRRITRR